MLVFCVAVVACGRDVEQNKPAPTLSQSSQADQASGARPYNVVQKRDSSFPGRNRLSFLVSSSAESVEARAETVVQAALDLQKRTTAHLVEVTLYPTEKLAIAGGTYTAKALYAPDGGGYSGDQGWKWNVCVSSSPYSQQNVELEEAWLGNQERFRLVNGGVNEAALKKFLAAKLGRPISEIELPMLSCDKTVNVN